jgi:hypothetical protein
MLDVNTILTPRDEADDAVRVCGVEGDRYVVTSALHFGTPFALTVDEVAARYVCDGYTLAINHESEAAAWAKMSNETFRPSVRPAPEPELSPEQFFAAAAQDAT